MESLRWVLLAVGIIFVLAIYLIGRNKRRNNTVIDELDDDLPEFSARNLDDVDEGVGEVRVVTGAQHEDVDLVDTAESAADKDDYVDDVDGDVVPNDAEEAADQNRQPENPGKESPEAPPDFIVLYILPKANQQLLGSQVNSSAQAMGLSFGDMNIFHYRPEGRNIFSLANMLEPGSFDPDTIHDMRTSGLTVFMKITGADPLDDLTEMLQRSYQLAGLLDARLCNSQRQPLTEQDAENYRVRIRDLLG